MHVTLLLQSTAVDIGHWIGLRLDACILSVYRARMLPVHVVICFNLICSVYRDTAYRWCVANLLTCIAQGTAQSWLASTYMCGEDCACGAGSRSHIPDTSCSHSVLGEKSASDVTAMLST